MKFTTKEFKGNTIFQIWKEEAIPGSIKDFPVVSFGIKKAKAISESIKAIQKFIQMEEAK